MNTVRFLPDVQNTKRLPSLDLQEEQFTDLFSHAGHTQHCKIQSVDFQMGRVILTNYFNSHPSLRYSGHTAFKLVKRTSEGLHHYT
jgi:hypothetical protein